MVALIALITFNAGFGAEVGADELLGFKIQGVNLVKLPVGDVPGYAAGVGENRICVFPKFETSEDGTKNVIPGEYGAFFPLNKNKPKIEGPQARILYLAAQKQWTLEQEQSRTVQAAEKVETLSERILNRDDARVDRLRLPYSIGYKVTAGETALYLFPALEWMQDRSSASVIPGECVAFYFSDRKNWIKFSSDTAQCLYLKAQERFDSRDSVDKKS